MSSSHEPEFDRHSDVQHEIFRPSANGPLVDDITSILDLPEETIDQIISKLNHNNVTREGINKMLAINNTLTTNLPFPALPNSAAFSPVVPLSDGETTIFDLPDEMIENIFSHLTFPDRSRVRVNRRLWKTERGMKITDKEEIKWKIVQIIKSSTKSFKLYFDKHECCGEFSFESIERLAKNVQFGRLLIVIDFRRTRQFYFVTKPGLFNSHELVLQNNMGIFGGANRSDKTNFEIIQNLLNSHSIVRIDSVCTSVTVDELELFREITRTGKTNLLLELHITNEVAFEYADRFFGLDLSSDEYGDIQIKRTNAAISGTLLDAYANGFIYSTPSGATTSKPVRRSISHSRATKRLPVLLLPVACCLSVGVLGSLREAGWLKRSSEEGDCLLDCKKEGKLSIQACLHRCKITKRSTEDEEFSAQNDPLPWQVNGPGKRSADDSYSSYRCYFDLSTQPWEPTPFGPWKRLAEEQGSYNCYARCMANPHNENCSRWCSPGKRSTEEGDCIQDCHQKEGFSWQVCLRRCHVTKRSIEEILKTGL